MSFCERTRPFREQKFTVWRIARVSTNPQCLVFFKWAEPRTRDCDFLNSRHRLFIFASPSSSPCVSLFGTVFRLPNSLQKAFSVPIARWTKKSRFAEFWLERVLNGVSPWRTGVHQRQPSHDKIVTARWCWTNECTASNYLLKKSSWSWMHTHFEHPVGLNRSLIATCVGLGGNILELNMIHVCKKKTRTLWPKHRDSFAEYWCAEWKNTMEHLSLCVQSEDRFFWTKTPNHVRRHRKTEKKFTAS